jgi:hypothetical protein
MKMLLFGFGKISPNFTEKIVQTFVSQKIYWKTKLFIQPCSFYNEKFECAPAVKGSGQKSETYFGS